MSALARRTRAPAGGGLGTVVVVSASGGKNNSTLPNLKVCPGSRIACRIGTELKKVPLVEPRSFTMTVSCSKSISQ